MKPYNLLILLSDEHNPDVMSCAGHPEVHTPHLDALARKGKRFLNATCASPICVPARAALATGLAVHEMGYWDNVGAYDGQVRSWHHSLRDAGHEVVSIGKLHYRGWEGDDYGFTQSLLPMHIHKGRGEVKMLLRDPPAPLGDGSNMLKSAKAGESDYNRYDAQICNKATQWLQAKAQPPASAHPWVLMVSMVAPHFPLTVPASYFEHYRQQHLRMPKQYAFGVNTSAHPFVQQYGKLSGYNLHFKSDDDVRRALSAYYGLVTYLDQHVGKLLETLASTGLADHTRVLYLSDHGDNVGARGLWGKSTMYRESVGVPMILTGPDIPAGCTESAAVSHTDLFKTIHEAVGAPLPQNDTHPHTQSLLQPLAPDRIVLSEYHTVGSKSAVYMIQNAERKYVHYCDMPPEFFDLTTDPEETVNLAHDASRTLELQHWQSLLRQRLDPDLIDRKAKARQHALIDIYGGEQAIRNGSAIGGYTPTPTP